MCRKIGQEFCMLAEPEQDAEGKFRSPETDAGSHVPRPKQKTVPKNCWEFHVCMAEVRDKCPAFLMDMGKECWLIASTYQAEHCPSKKHSGVLDCVSCAWYLSLNPRKKEDK